MSAIALTPSTPGHDRVLAPLGRRLVRVTRTSLVGAYAVLEVGDPDGPRPQPGQFYMLLSEARWGGGHDERPFLPRAFSHASTTHARAEDADGGGDGSYSSPVCSAGDAPPELSFVLEAVGPGTTRLAELRAGDGLWLLGPLGRPFRAPRDGRRPLLVGGGVGIAPIAVLAEDLGTAAGSVLLGFRDGPHAEAAKLVPGARVATDDGSEGHHGLVTALVEAELDRDAHREVYACGPPPMLEAIRRICATRGVPGQLALESGMACGFGACFGCVVPLRAGGYARLCVDGPVLDAELVEAVVHP